MRRLVTPRWLAAHVAVLVLVAAFLALAGWQAGRAADGNLLSWGYTFEWPLFAIFLIVLWIREMRLAVRAERTGGSGIAQAPATQAAGVASSDPVTSAASPSGGTPVPRRGPVITRRLPPATDAAADPQLAAYNEYLTWLNEHPEARPSDYPG